MLRTQIRNVAVLHARGKDKLIVQYKYAVYIANCASATRQPTISVRSSKQMTNLSKALHMDSKWRKKKQIDFHASYHIIMVASSCALFLLFID